VAGLAGQLGEEGALGATVALPEGMSGGQLAEIVSEAIQEAVTLEAAQVALTLERSQLRCEVALEVLVGGEHLTAVGDVDRSELPRPRVDTIEDSFVNRL